MNTDKTIRDKFAQRTEYPIWYYKEIQKVDIAYVIFELLNKTFVVEINGSKHEIIFGKNRKGQIGRSITYDDIKHSNLCSFEVINKGFKEGIWYVVTDEDTSEEFKADYIKRKEEATRQNCKDMYLDILSEWIREHKDLNNIQKEAYLKLLKTYDYDKLEDLIKRLCGGK